jgi:hypothetical protein
MLIKIFGAKRNVISRLANCKIWSPILYIPPPVLLHSSNQTKLNKQDMKYTQNYSPKS